MVHDTVAATVDEVLEWVRRTWLSWAACDANGFPQCLHCMHTHADTGWGQVPSKSIGWDKNDKSVVLEIVVSGLFRRRHSLYQYLCCFYCYGTTDTSSHHWWSCVSGCCVACLEFPSNFGQGNPATACVPPEIDDSTVCHLFFGRL